MIPENIIQEIDTPGQAISFGTTGADLQPKIGRALAVKTGSDKKTVSFTIPKKYFEMHKQNLQPNKMVSLNVTYPPTHKSYQFKGLFREWNEAGAAEQEITSNNVNAFYQILMQFYGEDAAKNFLKYHVKDLIHVKMDVNEIFDQTPGPGAGKKIFSI